MEYDREGGTEYEEQIEDVLAAAESLVCVIGVWIPDLVPEPRTLVEVLETIASWHKNEQTVRTEVNAAKFMENLQAEEYGVQLPDFAAFPDLDKFLGDLRATLELVKKKALS